MNGPHSTRGAVAPSMLLALCLTLAPIAIAGDLNPPPGPVAPTMKSLDALAPGICINTLPGAPDAVHLITEPGHYVLTDDVIAPAGTSAIVVDLNPALPPGTHNVSIDLAGHDLLGDPGSLHAIHFRPSAPGVKKECDAKKHKDLIASRIDGFGGNGILCEGEADLSLSGLTISNCAGHGVSGSFCCCIRITDIHVLSCGDDGIHIEDAIECELGSIEVSGCVGDGIEVLRCDRIRSDLAIECERRTGTFRVANCGGDGIHIEDAIECNLDAFDISDCGGNGVHCLRVQKPRHVVAKEVLTGRLGQVSNCAGHAILLTDADDFEIGALEVTDCTGSALQATASAAPVRKKAKMKGIILVNGGGTLATAALHIDGFEDVEIEGLNVSGYAGVALNAIASSSGLSTVLKKTGSTFTGELVFTTTPAMTIDGFDEIELEDVRVIDHAGPAISATAATSARRKKAGTQGPIIINGGGTLATAAVTLDGFDDVEALGLDIADYAGPSFSATAGAAPVARKRKLKVGDKMAGRHGNKSINFDIVEVVDADITALDDTGLDITGATDVTLRRVRLADCNLDGINAVCENLELHDVTALRNGSAGGRLTVSGNLVISGLRVHDNGDHGLQCSGNATANASITDFHATGNGFASAAHGISLDNFASATLTNGQCRANAGSGIRLADFNRDGVLDLVVCSSNNSHGIHVLAPGGLPNGRCRVTHATCDNNSGNGLFLEASTGGEVTDSNLTNNANTGLVINQFGHVVHRNACLGNAGGALLVPLPGNVVGPLIDELSIGGNANPAANYTD